MVSEQRGHAIVSVMTSPRRPPSLRRFGRCDFLQAHHSSNIAVFVNSFPIFIRLRGLNLNMFIADAALRQSHVMNEL
jgi:hypothetical protein